MKAGLKPSKFTLEEEKAEEEKEKNDKETMDAKDEHKIVAMDAMGNENKNMVAADAKDEDDKTNEQVKLGKEASDIDDDNDYMCTKCKLCPDCERNARCRKQNHAKCWNSVKKPYKQQKA